MKRILSLLFEHKTLDRATAKEVLVNIGKGVYNEHEITSFMTVYLMRSISLQELQGFQDALLELCVPLDFNGIDTIDIVGTGGDGKNTFNISTLSCFVVAGTGHKVTKHGNYGASTVSGASNVVESMGYRFKNNNAALTRELEAANICFLHAPQFHPALKNVGPIRKNLGMRTFFNMLGPLVNPAFPSFSIIGVYNLEMARLYNYLMQQQSKHFAIVHGLDGYDEISLTGDSKVITATGEQVLSAMELGGREVKPESIRGGTTVEEAAKIFSAIIRGKGTPEQEAVVLANSAIALQVTGVYPNYADAFEAAKESLRSGRAYECLQKLIALQ
ncbi:anthranilate phosphoribosyltransferase [Niabella ginsenosidivorans]|uniref:Anthranilate phosphoribosyltransferase n=1 Tax=Niabella ginsenosidivorans TaxID=1176587 RepID=A0A1A9HYE2_9BACT|nr:anthranilate phosphoribosyltransferase [Niabella ginsenosidivorans]ANH79839.1 anthranilate phosphoribosyltransferase [Niabella ginsenosidivorans]